MIACSKGEFMLDVDMVRTLVAYHHALNQRVCDSVDQVAEEQFVGPLGYSRGSLRDQMVHMANTDAGWLRGLKELPDARQYRLEPGDYPTAESVRALWVATAEELRAYVSSLTSDELVRTPEGLPATVWQVLLHLVNHGTDHRAQILRIVHDYGAPTFDQDLIWHFMGR